MCVCESIFRKWPNCTNCKNETWVLQEVRRTQLGQANRLRKDVAAVDQLLLSDGYPLLVLSPRPKFDNGIRRQVWNENSSRYSVQIQRIYNMKKLGWSFCPLCQRLPKFKPLATPSILLQSFSQTHFHIVNLSKPQSAQNCPVQSKAISNPVNAKRIELSICAVEVRSSIGAKRIQPAAHRSRDKRPLLKPAAHLCQSVGSR